MRQQQIAPRQTLGSEPRIENADRVDAEPIRRRYQCVAEVRVALLRASSGRHRVVANENKESLRHSHTLSEPRRWGRGGQGRRDERRMKERSTVQRMLPKSR